MLNMIHVVLAWGNTPQMLLDRCALTVLNGGEGWGIPLPKIIDGYVQIKTVTETRSNTDM